MKEQIINLLKLGKSFNAISKELGCSKSTISYHAKKLTLHKHPQASSKRYNWEEIIPFYKEHGFNNTRRHFGMSINALNSYIKRHQLKTDARPQRTKTPISDFLVIGRTQTSCCALKKRLIDEGLLRAECYAENCNITNLWLDNPISLHLDHINGNRFDNRLQNLRLLCPNCHSQTPTYSGRNRKYKTGRDVGI